MKLDVYPVTDTRTRLGVNTLQLWRNDDCEVTITHVGRGQNINVGVETPLGRQGPDSAHAIFNEYLMWVEKRKAKLNVKLFEQEKGHLVNQIWEPRKMQENKVDWLPEAKRRLQQIKGEMKLRELMA